jgi:phosphate ABC transporter phosphate-binding protein
MVIDTVQWIVLMHNTTRFAGFGWLPKLILFSLLLVPLGCHKSDTGSAAKTVTGSGSTFVYHVITKWADEYEKREDGCPVAYRSLGSGDGIKQITEKAVDFACSDAPMSDMELAEAREVGGEIVHIPLVLGAVVPAYNLPEIKEPLRFTGPVLADIYLGKIKNWNDDALQKLNPGMQLPSQTIDVVRRADDSGTTYVWTDYFSKVSPEWQSKVGTGHEVKWPTGKNEVGNEGVAAYLKSHPGSLGYIELSYAYRKDLHFGLVQNREGEYIKGGLLSTTAAANNALEKIPDDLRYSITDAPGKGSYPICGTTWALVYLKQPAGKGAELVKFLHWSLEEGQEYCEGLFYARLPEALVSRAKNKLDQLQVAKKPG